MESLNAGLLGGLADHPSGVVRVDRSLSGWLEAGEESEVVGDD